MTNMVDFKQVKEYIESLCREKNDKEISELLSLICKKSNVFMANILTLFAVFCKF